MLLSWARDIVLSVQVDAVESAPCRLQDERGSDDVVLVSLRGVAPLVENVVDMTSSESQIT